MAEWKKIIVSGSAASLASVNADGTISASVFSASMGFHGDGSGLSNITADSANTASYVSGSNVDGEVASASLATTSSYIAGANVDGAVENATTASYVLTSSIVDFDSHVSASAAASGFGGGGISSMDTSSFYISSSASGSTLTFRQGDGSDDTLTVDNVTTALTASYVDLDVVLDGSGIASSSTQVVNLIDGQDVSLGTVTATELVTEIVSSSIILTTGSNIFGDELTDNHEFTGSVSVTGSVTATSFTGDGSGLTNITADTADTASYVEGVNVDGAVELADTASYIDPSLVTNSVTGSARTLAQFSAGGGVEDSTITEAGSEDTITTLNTVTRQDIGEIGPTGDGAASWTFITTGLAASFSVGDTFEIGNTTHTVLTVNAGTNTITTSVVFTSNGNVVPQDDITNAKDAEVAGFTDGDDFDVTTPGAPFVISINADLTVTGSVTANSLTLSHITASAGSTFTLQVDDSGSVSAAEAVSSDTGSLLTTASIASGSDITFTKGDGTTFDIIVDSVESASFATTASHVLNVDLSATSASYINDNVVVGTAGEVTVASSSGQLTIGLPDDVTIAGNLTVQGTQINLNVANLDVEDKFIILNSGSAAGDAGIVFNQGGNVGPALGYDQSATRLGYQLNLSGSATTIAPDAFVTLTSEGGSGENAPADASLDSAVEQKGSIFIGDNGDIYIYS